MGHSQCVLMDNLYFRQFVIIQSGLWWRWESTDIFEQMCSWQYPLYIHLYYINTVYLSFCPIPWKNLQSAAVILLCSYPVMLLWMMLLISIIQRIMSRARNLMHMKEVCDSGVNNAVRNKVTNFYVKIYIFFNTFYL